METVEHIINTLPLESATLFLSRRKDGSTHAALCIKNQQGPNRPISAAAGTLRGALAGLQAEMARKWQPGGPRHNYRFVLGEPTRLAGSWTARLKSVFHL